MNVVPLKPEEVMLTLAQDKMVYCLDADNDHIWNLYYQEVNVILNMLTDKDYAFFTVKGEGADDN